MNENNNLMPEINNQQEIEIKKTSIKEKPTLISIILFLGIVIVFLAVIIICKSQKSSDPTNKPEQPSATITQEPKIDSKFDEFNKHTSLRLKNYENIEPGSISEGQPTDDEEKPYNLISGIITFRAKAKSPDEFYFMNILDRSNVKNEEQESFFMEAYQDIKNKNPEKIAKTGKPWAFYTTVAGTPMEDFMTEIKDVSYPNTDYIYSILFLTHGHETAVADEESTNYVIRVFAIKQDLTHITLIELESYGNLSRDIGLSKEDHLKCAEMTGPNEETDWLTYNINCLSEIFSSGKYDEQLTAITKEVVTAFEIK